jgi:endonuclease/exonuclease/phosphatase (EEP) superfamily protein YafD
MTDSTASHEPNAPHPDSLDRRARRRRIARRRIDAFALLAWVALLTVWSGHYVPTLGFGIWPDFLVEIAASLTHPFGLLVVLVVAYAAWLRSPVRALVLAPVALCLLVPEYVRTGGDTHGRSTLRVATANLLAGNEHEAQRTIASLRALDADILALVEFTPRWRAALRAAFSREDYPYRIEVVREDPFGIAVWSRLEPTGPHETRPLHQATPQLRVPLTHEGREFSFYALHPGKPFPRWSWTRAVVDRSMLLEWFASHGDEPAILAGDFNATPWSPWMRELARRGFENTGRAASGRLVSWPMLGRARFFAPLLGIQIDHVLVTEDFAVSSCGVGPATGADHRPVQAIVGWR